MCTVERRTDRQTERQTEAKRVQYNLVGWRIKKKRTLLSKCYFYISSKGMTCRGIINKSFSNAHFINIKRI